MLDLESGEVIALAQRAYGTIEGLRRVTWNRSADLDGCRRNNCRGMPRNRGTSAAGGSKQSGSADSNMPWSRSTSNDPCARPSFGAMFNTRAVREIQEGIQRQRRSDRTIGNRCYRVTPPPSYYELKGMSRRTSPPNERDVRMIIDLLADGERQMEYGDASGTGLMDVRTRRWASTRILKFIDPKLEWLLLHSAHRTPDRIVVASCASNGDWPMTPSSAREAATT